MGAFLHLSMEWGLVKYLLLVLIVLVQMDGHKGCFEEERMGLLDFKTTLRSSGGAVVDYLLPSWIHDGDSNCCEWERVTCNATTGHVIPLPPQCYTNIIFRRRNQNWVFRRLIVPSFQRAKKFELIL